MRFLILAMAFTLPCGVAAAAPAQQRSAGVAEKLAQGGLLTRTDMTLIASARNAVRHCLRAEAGAPDRLARCAPYRATLQKTRLQILLRLRGEVREAPLRKLIEDRIRRAEARLRKIEASR